MVGVTIRFNSRDLSKRRLELFVMAGNQHFVAVVVAPDVHMPALERTEQFIPIEGRKGAAGALEFVVSSLVVRDGVIPPTINYANPDPECDLDYTPNAPANRDVEYALSNSFGFGGHNVTLAVKKYRE